MHAGSLYIHGKCLCGYCGQGGEPGHWVVPLPSALALPLRQEGELQPLCPGAGLMGTDVLSYMDLVGHYLWQRP